MDNYKNKRCRYCGGTLWRDSDIVKCFMCSRPADGSGTAAWPSAASSGPSRQSTLWKNAYRTNAK